MRRHLQQTLKLRDLRVINAVAREGSILGASRALSLTQPATSKALQAIETLFATPLFERGPKGVTPTPCGVAVAETAARILREVTALDRTLDSLVGEDAGPVVIGAQSGAANGVLLAALAHLSAQNPEIDVHVVEGSCERLLDQLTDGGLELVVGRLIESPCADRLVQQQLYDESLSVVARAGHPLFSRESVARDRLEAFQLVMPTIDGQAGREIDEYVAAIAPNTRNSIKSGSFSLVRELIYSTDRLAVLPRVTMTGDIRRGAVRVVPVSGPSKPRPAGLIRRGGVPLRSRALAVANAVRVCAPTVAAEA